MTNLKTADGMMLENVIRRYIEDKAREEATSQKINFAKPDAKKLVHGLQDLNFLVGDTKSQIAVSWRAILELANYNGTSSEVGSVANALVKELEEFTHISTKLEGSLKMLETKILGEV